jgi:threonine dehydrogenase-like Zn-dependent dehydrogenase
VEAFRVRAITVQPGVARSARLDEVPDPPASEGSVLVRTLAIGVCGTDIEIVRGEYGTAPAGADRLILGHESLGEVVEAPRDSGLTAGQHVAGIVRQPDPVPCASCAAGEWDMCRNGQYTEHGIKGLHGFGADYFRLDPRFAVPVDRALGLAGVLIEPTSVVAKAWDHIERIAARATWRPSRVLVTGAGPIGLLAALLGRQRGLEVHVLDKVTDGPKPDLVRGLGAVYYSSSVQEAGRGCDIAVECTGVSHLVLQVMHVLGPSGIACLTGVSSGGRSMPVDLGSLNRELVLENNVVFGTVNANRRHYEMASEALGQADPGWLDRVINRRVPVEHWSDALERLGADVKPIVTF